MKESFTIAYAFRERGKDVYYINTNPAETAPFSMVSVDQRTGLAFCDECEAGFDCEHAISVQRRHHQPGRRKQP